MQKSRIVAVMLGGLFLASPAMAQSTNLAYATGEPRSEYMVFLEKAMSCPSRRADGEQGLEGGQGRKTIHLVGRADQAEIVKQG